VQLQLIARAQSRSVQQGVAALNPPPLIAPPPPSRETRLRVGYLSADIRQHPLSYLMRGVFALLDRIRIEATLFSTGPEDASSPLRREIAAAVEHFVDLNGVPAAQALRQLRAARLHVLVDLNGMC
jgi:predicted O-linked N-acetylglucosamine transferase (SPINDLY family)